MQNYNEHELADVATIWGGYTYVINGEPKVLVLPEGFKKMTVGEFKAATIAPDGNNISITNCDMKARNLPLKRG